MKTLLLITALCLPIMAQTPQPEIPASIKADVAARIEEARAFAEAALANPGLIETTAKANRMAVLSRSHPPGLLSMTNITAQQLYQIQEKFGLDAALAATRLLATLPTLSKAEVLQ